MRSNPQHTYQERRLYMGRWIAHTIPPGSDEWEWIRSEEAHELWRETHDTPEEFSEGWAWAWVEGRA